MQLETKDNQDEFDLGALLNDLALHGVQVPAGTMMSVDPDFPILYATLTGPYDFRGFHLTAGCQFRFTSVLPYGFPGMAIPLWLVPLLIVYLVYRLIRRVLVGSGRYSVQVYFPPEADRPDPDVGLYDVATDTLLPVATAKTRPRRDR